VSHTSPIQGNVKGDNTMEPYTDLLTEKRQVSEKNQSLILKKKKAHNPTETSHGTTPDHNSLNNTESSCPIF
jgi:hypothetical protein